jgi:hypothetical protein
VGDAERAATATATSRPAAVGGGSDGGAVAMSSKQRGHGGAGGAKGVASFVLPAHLVQALRADDELGARTAAAAALPYCGVTYASLLALYTPLQPAARKTLQKKKADAALDRQWEKELRRKQRETEKAKKDREEKVRKEKEKERRRADKEERARKEKEAARGAEESSGGGGDGGGGNGDVRADNAVTELIALRMRERILARETAAASDNAAGRDEPSTPKELPGGIGGIGGGGGNNSGGGNGGGGDAPKGVAGSGRLLLRCAAATSEFPHECGGCLEVLPEPEPYTLNPKPSTLTLNPKP